jgi:hypothetical protein
MYSADASSHTAESVAKCDILAPVTADHAPCRHARAEWAAAFTHERPMPIGNQRQHNNHRWSAGNGRVRTVRPPMNTDAVPAGSAAGRGGAYHQRTGALGQSMSNIPK